MRISHIAPFAVSAALSRACGRGRRVSARSARRFGCSNDAAGHRTAISRSGEAFGDLSGAVDAYGYNLRSEVVSARRTKGGASVRGFDEDFSYDPIGNRIATTNYTETGSAIVSEYSANNLNQYTSRTVPGVAAVRGFADANATVTVNENPTWRLGEYFYGSDEFDNSAAPVDAALVTTAALASPTNGPDEVASVTSRVHIAKTPQLFEYDLDGNQTLVTTKTGTWSVTYDGENRPIRWMRINVADTNGQTMISMNFDHQGRRRLYLETAADGSTNRLDRFTYDNYLCVARNRWQPDGTSATDRFFWDPTEPVATRPLVFYQPNASPQLYAVDGNKNISELVSFDDGTISAHYEYAPFGEVILSSGNLAITNPFRFSSEYAEADTATVYYNYRHYEPVAGRWLSRDPIEERGGMNLLVFVKNGPISKLDIRGKYLTVDECQKIVDRLWDGWDDVGPSIDGEILMMQILLQTNDCGCKRPRCFCTIEHKAGHYDSNNNLVEINAYRSTKDSVRNTVLHEMQHAYDQCIIGDIADCADRAKREVRAVIRSGRCGRGSKIDWACVKDTAKRSVDKFRECRDTSVEDVESYVKFFLEKLKGVL